MATILALAAPTTFAIDKRSGNPVGVPPGTVADYVRPVIMAHRHFSTIHIVNRLRQERSRGIYRSDTGRPQQSALCDQRGNSSCIQGWHPDCV